MDKDFYEKSDTSKIGKVVAFENIDVEACGHKKGIKGENEISLVDDTGD